MSAAPQSEAQARARDVAERWRAEERHGQRKSNQRVEEMRSEDEAGPSDGASSSSPPDGQQESLTKLAVMGWTFLDMMATKLSPKLELLEKEKRELVEVTVPWLETVLPDDVEVGPGTAVILTAGFIYGGKMLSARKSSGTTTPPSGGESKPGRPEGIPPGKQTIDVEPKKGAA